MPSKQLHWLDFILLKFITYDSYKVILNLKLGCYPTCYVTRTCCTLCIHNIILRLARNNKNNTNFYTKARYKTPWIFFLHLQMVFWVEISLEILKFHR